MLLTDFFIRVLGDIFGSTVPSLIIIPPALLAVFCLIFGRVVEKRWYREYILSAESEISAFPFVSFAFAFAGIYIMVVYTIALYVASIVPLSNLIQAFVLLFSAIVTILILVLILKITQKALERKN